MLSIIVRDDRRIRKKRGKNSAQRRLDCRVGERKDG